MGLVGVQEKGNGEVGLSIGTKNKYRGMDSEVTEDFDDGSHHHHQEKRSSSTRKYVLACAIFASLNSVLLGYGNQALIFFLPIWDGSAVAAVFVSVVLVHFVWLIFVLDCLVWPALHA